jgi:hypothetical protein
MARSSRITNCELPIAHNAAIVSADVPIADVTGHDDKNVGLLLLLREGWRAYSCRGYGQNEQHWPDLSSKAHHTPRLSVTGGITCCEMPTVQRITKPNGAAMDSMLRHDAADPFWAGRFRYSEVTETKTSRHSLW